MQHGFLDSVLLSHLFVPLGKKKKKELIEVGGAVIMIYAIMVVF